MSTLQKSTLYKFHRWSKGEKLEGVLEMTGLQAMQTLAAKRAQGEVSMFDFIDYEVGKAKLADLLVAQPVVRKTEVSAPIRTLLEKSREKGETALAHPKGVLKRVIDKISDAAAKATSVDPADAAALATPEAVKTLAAAMPWEEMTESMTALAEGLTQRAMQVVILGPNEMTLLRKLEETPWVLLNRDGDQHLGLTVVEDSKPIVAWFSDVTNSVLKATHLEPEGLFGFDWWRIERPAGKGRLVLDPDVAVVYGNTRYPWRNLLVTVDRRTTAVEEASESMFTLEEKKKVFFTLMESLIK